MGAEASEEALVDEEVNLGWEGVVEAVEGVVDPVAGVEGQGTVAVARLGVYFRLERLQVGILIRPSHPPQRSPL